MQRRTRTGLLSARTLTWHDDKNAPSVAVINKEFAQSVRLRNKRTRQIVQDTVWNARRQVAGIVEDGKYMNFTEDPQPAAFRPILQSPLSELVVRSNRDPRQLAAAVQSRLQSLDPGLPFFIQTWNQKPDSALFGARVATVSLLGVMGAMLSVTGIFRMAAYSVSKRLRELGIRIALGAQRKEVLRAALGRAFKLLALGSAAGLILGMLSTRVLASIVYQATPHDPLVLAGVLLAMFLPGLLATWILSLNPVALQREE
jgi:hypothetical protein